MGHRFKPQHQRRLGIGRPDQSPAVIKEYPDAVNINHIKPLFKIGGHFFNNIKFDLVRALYPNFRRVKGLRNIFKKRRERLVFFGDNFHQAQGRIGGIIKTEIAICKKDMTAHFTSQSSVFHFHFGFDQRMTRFPHDGPATMFFNIIVHHLGAFDLGDKGGPGFTGQNLPRENYHQTITINDISFFIHDTNPVTVAVKPDTHIEFFLFNQIDQFSHVFGNSRIRRMIGKGPVHLTIEIVHFTAQVAHQRNRHNPCGTVTGIDTNPKGPRQLDVIQKVFFVGRDRICSYRTPLSRFQNPLRRSIGESPESARREWRRYPWRV